MLLSNAAIIAADIFTIDDAWRERSGGQRIDRGNRAVHGALRRAAAIALCRAALENQHGCISVLGEELLPLRSVLPSTLLRKPLLTVGASVAFVASTAANGAESC